MNLITLTDGGGNYGCSETMTYDPGSDTVIVLKFFGISSSSDAS